MVKVVKPKSILLDIEGTTTSISYVKETLFPFARDNLEQHINNNWLNQELGQDIDALVKQSINDFTNGDIDRPLPDDPEDPQFKPSFIKYVNHLMSIDSKCTPLKQLQGHIWRYGFQNKLIKGHVYDDVSKAMDRWKNQHAINLYIYSSGSIEAQKLHFEHTNYGNLLPIISGHFDTTIGPKQESSSYTKIVEAINLHPKDVIFLTDVDKEAEAAAEAGLLAIIVLRPGNKPLNDETLGKFITITSFDEMTFEDQVSA